MGRATCEQHAGIPYPVRCAECDRAHAEYVEDLRRRAVVEDERPTLPPPNGWPKIGNTHADEVGNG